MGIAVSDSKGSMATPLTTLYRADPKKAGARKAGGAQRVGGQPGVAPDALYMEILDIAVEYEAGWVVVGLPVNMDGSEGPAALSARSEAAELAALGEHYGIRVELMDERLTSSHSERSLSSLGLDGKRSRRVVDQVAASVLLQSWLDAQRIGDP